MSNFERIRRVSLVIRAVCTVGVVAVPVLLAALWATADSWIRIRPEFAGIAVLPEPLPAWSRAASFLVSMIPGGLVVLALLNLRRLFGLYAAGNIFTGEAVGRLRRFALIVILVAIARPAVNAAISVVLTFGNPPGERALALSFGSSEVSSLVTGGIFLVIAWIMEEARNLAEEQAQIV